ncbi:MAG TPA: hypothetical protein VFW23_18285 [Tepidisphaeraceae bacterium]|nr:hypothetical protein [Tepidisphaeraceae bacterium]
MNLSQPLVIEAEGIAQLLLFAGNALLDNGSTGGARKQLAFVAPVVR